MNENQPPKTTNELQRDPWPKRLMASFTKRNWQTHAGHALIAVAMMLAGFLFAWPTVALNATYAAVGVKSLGFLIGSFGIVYGFTYREGDNIFMPLVGVLWPGETYASRRAAMTVFTDKLIDGLGDWWAPFAVIPLTALVLSYIGG